MNMVHDLPEDLRIEIKSICENMDTPLNIHSFARHTYETVRSSEKCVDEPQMRLVGGSLSIAYELTNQDGMFGERKTSYNECSIVAPAADEGVLSAFADLGEFGRFSLVNIYIGHADQCSTSHYICVMSPPLSDPANGVADLFV